MVNCHIKLGVSQSSDIMESRSQSHFISLGEVTVSDDLILQVIRNPAEKIFINLRRLSFYKEKLCLTLEEWSETLKRIIHQQPDVFGDKRKVKIECSLYTISLERPTSSLKFRISSEELVKLMAIDLQSIINNDPE